MRSNWLLAALAVAACHKSKPSPPQPAPTGSADPWATKAPEPDTPEKRKARAEAALGRVAGIMPKLAKLRQLDFIHDIPRELQSTDDFRKAVHLEVARDLPADKAADISRAMFALGLLDKPVNLADIEEQATVTQAAAYYDPRQKRFFIVVVPDSADALDMVSAHELTHGLQDQHFDLQAYLPDEGSGGAKLDDDASAARRFVVEGDATFTMFAYLAMAPDGSLPDASVALLVAQLQKFAGMSIDDFAKMGALMSGTDPSMKASSDAMKDIPATVLVPMIDSYMTGGLLAISAYKRGGWKAVDDLFAHPPESTEQAMHPDKLGVDHPHHVTLGKLAGKQLADVVLGELQWQIYFGLWAPEQKQLASEGWGGDRESVIARDDGRLVARIATTWDTPKDADEFTAAYLKSLAKRFPDAQGDASTNAGLDRGSAGKIFVEKDGSDVFVIDGADSAKDLAAFVSATKIAR